MELKQPPATPQAPARPQSSSEVLDFKVTDLKNAIINRDFARIRTAGPLIRALRNRFKDQVKNKADAINTGYQYMQTLLQLTTAYDSLTLKFSLLQRHNETAAQITHTIFIRTVELDLRLGELRQHNQDGSKFAEILRVESLLAHLEEQRANLEGVAGFIVDCAVPRENVVKMLAIECSVLSTLLNNNPKLKHVLMEKFNTNKKIDGELTEENPVRSWFQAYNDSTATPVDKLKKMVHFAHSACELELMPDHRNILTTATIEETEMQDEGAQMAVENVAMQDEAPAQPAPLGQMNLFS